MGFDVAGFAASCHKVIAKSNQYQNQGRRFHVSDMKTTQEIPPRHHRPLWHRTSTGLQDLLAMKSIQTGGPGMWGEY